jgi:hypothetical protein
MQTPDSTPSSTPPTGPTTSAHLETSTVLSYQQRPLIFQRQAAPVVADAPVRNPSPTFCLCITRPRSLSDRPPTVQAYDRPVVFADDTGIQERRSAQPSMGHKRNPTMPASSRQDRSNSSSRSGSTRKQGRKRSASFSEFVAPHLIGRASNASDVPAAAPTSKPRSQGSRGGGLVKSAPPSPAPPPYGYGEEKKKRAEGWSSPTDPFSSLPTLSAMPPPLPPKDYPASGAQQQSGATCVPHVAMRLTARVLGRTLGAARGGQHSPKGQSADDGWVVV